MNAVNVIVVLNVLFLTFVVGIYAGRGIKDINGFAVGKRSYGTWALFCTLSASYIGGGYTFGISEKTFQYGIVYIFCLLGFSLQQFFVAIVLAPRMNPFYKAISVGDIMGSFYGKLGKVITGIASVVVCAGIIGAQVTAMGYVFQLFLGIEQVYGIIIGCGIVIAYSVFGGMQAVVATDILQFAILIFVIPLTLILGIYYADGFGNIFQQVPTNHFTIPGDMPILTMISLFLSFLFGEALVPPYVQRLFITKNVITTKRGTLYSSINNTLANNNPSIVPLIAETGGQNAMIVDSSALIEQVCDDILISAFYSAGQRCSALRVVYIQEEIYKPLLDMIKSATELLQISDTVDFSTDIGPVIDKTSYDVLISHIENMQKKGFKVFTHPQKGGTKGGHYFYPHIIEINSINDIENENFGPVLHVIKYKTKKIDKVIDEINNYGYGLTFGIHSRIEEKIEYLRNKIKAGNIYANRSIVGAKVESQPFGGENKSGTGFKAGGPNYLLKFMLERTTSINLTAIGGNVDLLTE